MNHRLRSLEARAAALIRPSWTFEQFKAEWETADPLSKSLYELAGETPELCGGEDAEYISSYLSRMGYEIDRKPFDFNELEGDEP